MYVVNGASSVTGCALTVDESVVPILTPDLFQSNA
jgi:hypothetical protein